MTKSEKFQSQKKKKKENIISAANSYPHQNNISLYGNENF